MLFSFYYFNIAFSIGKEAENDFKVTFDKLNHRFFDFIQIAFWAGQDVEIEVAVPCNHKKNRLFTSPKSYFGLIQKPNIS